MTPDPVCGMAVEREHAVELAHKGTPYYFCSEGCGWQFERSPDEFTVRAGDGSTV